MATDVDAALVDLGSALAWAEPGPGFVDGVSRRVGRRWHRKSLVAALVAAVIGVGLSPALADRFGVEHVRVKEVEELPPADDDLELGRPVTLADARAAVDFPLRVPLALGRPDSVHRGSPPGGVTMRWVEPDVLLTEHPGELVEVVKMVPEGSTSQPVTVDGAGGLWLTGPHVVTYTTADGEVLAEPPRRTGNTLVWTRDGVLTRIEVDGPLREALAVAASLSPVP